MYIMYKCPDCGIPHVRDEQGNTIRDEVVMATIPIPVIMNAMAMLAAAGGEPVCILEPGEDEAIAIVGMVLANEPLGGVEL
jgi:hypothetical protein